MTDDLQVRFTYHAPTEGQASLYQTLRGEALKLAVLIDQYTPESREKSLAITKLEEAVMWANAAIARRS